MHPALNSDWSFLGCGINDKCILCGDYNGSYMVNPVIALILVAEKPMLFVFILFLV